MTKIRLIQANDLTPDLVRRWNDIQVADASLASPYFRPEFTLAVANIRDDVEVAIIQNGDDVRGFFPFQRDRGNVARPVGGLMSDYHGVIAGPDCQWDARQLLRGCGLRAWHFDHLLATQAPFDDFHWAIAPSPYLDLSKGWEGYDADSRQHHKSSYLRQLRKMRKCERELGEIRCEAHVDSDEVFETLVEWKVQQYERTGVTNVLQFDWTLNLLREVLSHQSESFRGRLSALYIGDSLAAILLSMQSGRTLHGWFSAYSEEFSRHSPGRILWIELARLSERMNVARIDMGKGSESFKQNFMSDGIPVAEGSVDLRPIRGNLRRQWYRLSEWMRQSPLRGPLLKPARLVRRLYQSQSHR